MIEVGEVKSKNTVIPETLKCGKRNLTESEIEILKKNLNLNSDGSWQNILVPEKKEDFDAELIRNCEFSGIVVLGRLVPVTLKYHDLVLTAGIYNSYLENVVTDDDVVIRNVSYLSNYKIGSRVILFNIQEMSCTNHSKFGRGILKEGEPESNRIWIGVGNENDARAVLPFEEMIPADAFIWSRYREDSVLQRRFLELTEYGNTKKLDTHGIVENDSVIKNTTLLKDVRVGSNCYIKGAFKLKNITILSSEKEPSQIGEGVELVNGIVGYASKVFYQAVAVRFVIGRNCQLKYGARLLNSVLGDNSTVSCCEILNNLIFPFHEQHHNSSFLIASTLCGQSNIASGATIGSNHNSRSPDGELFAGRGFWPGLCSDFKHNSKFASFTLIAKGSYQNELNIKYPFSLVATKSPCEPVCIIPAYWFLYNMYAVSRNKMKFEKRDKRVIKIQHIETDPIAPDTVQEILSAIERIAFLTKNHLIKIAYEGFENPAHTEDKILIKKAKSFLSDNIDSDIILKDEECQRKYGANIIKPAKAFSEYRKISRYFAVSAIVEYCESSGIKKLTREILLKIKETPLYKKWLNVGGQVIPEEKVEILLGKIKSGEFNNWEEVHSYYEECFNSYIEDKASYAVYILEIIFEKNISDFTAEDFTVLKADVIAVRTEMYHSALSSRMKDYDDEFRMITFRNSMEMEAVIGNITDNEFLVEMKPEIEKFTETLENLFKGLFD